MGFCIQTIAMALTVSHLVIGSAGSAGSVVLAFLGRSEVAPMAYKELLDEIQHQGTQKNLEILFPQGDFHSFEEMESEIQKIMTEHHGASLVYMGHGMGTNGGASAAQHYAVTTKAKAVLLLAGFLERTWRPDIVACAKTWKKQPSVICPKGLCPGGYLEDGVHNCSGPDIPSPSYPLTSLSIGGELDGLVRVSRMAEAWYTQQGLKQHQVKLVMGMSHSDLMSSVPSSISTQDLVSECGPSKAKSEVAKLIVDFLLGVEFKNDVEAEFFHPFTEMFVKEEGSWWWTSNSDERGSSHWAATAQQRLVDPLPSNFTWAEAENEFHLLSDEELIPPYYRKKHRPNITLSGGRLVGLTVTQLRYVEVSVLQTAAGLNGWEIIKEEKVRVVFSLKVLMSKAFFIPPFFAVLFSIFSLRFGMHVCQRLHHLAPSQAGILADRKLAIPDDGFAPTSAIEIATKLASRELAFKVCGVETSPSLDDGDRCKGINEDAYALALNVSSKEALKRFQKLGRPLVMTSDQKPVPPAGPWWIWKYLKFTDQGSEVDITSLYAFYPLSGPAYGAGNHYCKLLSPARVLEWIYVDGLRPVRTNMSSIIV